MTPNPLPLQISCSRPLFEVLADSITGGRQPLDWLICNYTVGELSVAGFGFFMILIGGVGLQQWSEGWTIPAVWVALCGSVLVTFLPGVVAARIFGLLVLGVALVFLGFWYWWGR